jgi:hypothetical protein
MTTVGKKLMVVLWFLEIKSVITRNAVTELVMEKIRPQIMFSDYFYNSFRKLVVFYTEKKRDNRTFLRKALIESRKHFLEVLK